MLTPRMLEKLGYPSPGALPELHATIVVRPRPEATAADAVELVEEASRRAANAVRRARDLIPAPLALAEVVAPAADEVPVAPLALGGTVLWDVTDAYEIMERVTRTLGPAPRVVDAQGAEWVWTLWLTCRRTPEHDRTVGEVWALEGG